MGKQKIINFGSINIDHVYKVADFVLPGQTISCLDYEIHPGGKGLNQSIALSRAGLETYHLGKIAAQDLWLKELLASNQINTNYLDLTGSVTGHAIIQVNNQGENCIVIHAGANRELTVEQINQALLNLNANACLLQNETNLIPEIISLAKQRNLAVFFNPAPFTKVIPELPFASIDCLILNETEAFEFCKTESVSEALNIFKHQYPALQIVLTLGKDGAIFQDANHFIEQAGFPVTALDTTAAGDTFIGFFIAEFLASNNPEIALKNACQAAAISVTKNGAAKSVPTKLEVEKFFN